MVIALLALGANLPSAVGDPASTLEAALAALDTGDVRVLRRSPWYRTEAVPAGSGPDFVNGAAAVETLLSAEALLARLHRVEATLGRERRTRWAPRACDLDLLAHGSQIVPSAEEQARWAAIDTARAATVTPERLILPHPRMQDRPFVLVPLADVAPDWCHPVTGRTVREMCDDLPQQERDAIRRLTRPENGPGSGDAG